MLTRDDGVKGRSRAHSHTTHEIPLNRAIVVPTMMEGGVNVTSAVILWWILSGLSVIFVVADWHHAPIDLTMHVGFVLIVAFMGPLGALMYVLTVREPLPGTHQAYIAPRWKQVVGSTVHCVSGDSVGIVGIAALTPWVLSSVDPTLEIVLEYVAGFLVGWLIFQALFMKEMAGGSYREAARSMFMP